MTLKYIPSSSITQAATLNINRVSNVHINNNDDVYPLHIRHQRGRPPSIPVSNSNVQGGSVIMLGYYKSPMLWSIITYLFFERTKNGTTITRTFDDWGKANRNY